MKRLFAILLLAAVLNANADVVFVANKNVGVQTLTAENVDAILKGKTKNWPNGSRIMLATLKEGAVNDSALTKYAGMNAEQFKSNWNRLVFTGKATEPKSFGSEKELVAYVASTENALGYVESSSLTDDVHVIKVE